jgi:hypothetical protein
MQYGREPGRGGFFFHHHDRRWMDRKEEVDVVDLKAYSDAVPTRDVCCVHEEHTHTHAANQILFVESKHVDQTVCVVGHQVCQLYRRGIQSSCTNRYRLRAGAK